MSDGIWGLGRLPTMVSLYVNRPPVRRVGALVVVALLFAACGGGGDAKTNSDAAGISASADATSTSAANHEAAAAGETSEATTTTRPAEASTSGGATPTTAAAAAGVADDTSGLPDAGEYHFHTTGTSKFGANPEQPVNVDTTTTVAHLGGGKVRQSSDDQVTVLQWTDSHVVMHTMDFTRQGFERHFEAKPPVQYAPVALQVGQKWGWKLTATDMPTTVEQASRVDRVETVTVDGKTMKAIVVVTKVTLSGDVTGTIDITQWVDPDSDLPARIHAKTNIVTFGFTSDTTSDFTGFDPR